MTIPRKDRVWEVWQGDTLVCSARMGLTREQAENKVENEKCGGTVMRAKIAPCICKKPYNSYSNDNPYCRYPHGGVR